MQTPWLYISIALLGAILSVFAAFLSLVAHKREWLQDNGKAFQRVEAVKPNQVHLIIESIPAVNVGGNFRDATPAVGARDISSDTHSTAIQL